MPDLGPPLPAGKNCLGSTPKHFWSTSWLRGAQGGGRGRLLRPQGVLHVFLLLLLLSVSLVTSCTTARSPVPDEKGPEISEYIIGVEDELHISVWREEALTRTVPVRPDGRISLPLAGEVVAAGLTPKQLEKEITERLAGYVQDLPVSVVVTEINHLRFYVVGEVTRPGAYPLRTRYISLVQALAVAGGFTDFADESGILVFRTMSDGGQKRFRVDYQSLVGRNSDNTFTIYPGDTVVVP